MVSLYMLTGQTRNQSMSFIIKSEDKLIVIDGGWSGDADFLTRYVRSLGGVVDGWFFTHAHLDHADAFRSYYERKAGQMEVRHVYFNFPSNEYFEKYEIEGKKVADATWEAINAYSIPHTTVHTGDVYDFGEFQMRVLFEPDESITENVINNASVVYRLETERDTVMFLGDLGVEGGRKLLETTPRELLKADYVQAAHHGQRGVDRPVYDAIDPDYVLWTTPDWLWDNNTGRGYDTAGYKTIVTRGWLSDIGIKKHYISKDGTHEIPLTVLY